MIKCLTGSFVRKLDSNWWDLEQSARGRLDTCWRLLIWWKEYNRRPCAHYHHGARRKVSCRATERYPKQHRGNHGRSFSRQENLKSWLEEHRVSPCDRWWPFLPKQQMDTETYENKLLQQEEVKKCEKENCSDAPTIEKTRRREGRKGARETKGTPWAVVTNVL